MSRGRKPFNSSITDNWEKTFFNSIGHYITLINKGLSKIFKNEPLSNHIKIVGGFAFKNVEYKSSGIPIIRISDFNNERLILDNVVYYEESPLLEKYVLQESDIIIALTGGTIGKLGIVQAGLGKLYLNQRVGKFDILYPEEFEKEYIYWIARGVESIVKNLAWGAAIPNVSPKQIEELNFPIPDKDIQTDIIRFLNDLREGKVNSEIYFDEEIENEIKYIQEKQVKTREVQDELSHQLTQLDNLNQAILQEAVQGKLVPQDPKDEPASELLKRIKAEKLNRMGLNRVGLNRVGLKPNSKKKTISPALKGGAIKPEEIPFEIPESWVWCKINELLSDFKNDLRTGPFGTALNKSEHKSKGIPVWGIESISKDGRFTNSNKIFVTDEKATELKSFGVKGGDLIISRSGTIGELCMLPYDIRYGLLSTNLMKISVNRDVIMPEFFCHIIKGSIHIKDMLTELCSGSTRLFITQSILSRLIFPLPPLSEQKRIVAEIEKQLAKTKQLKEHIIANQQATEQLLKALLHQAFEVKEVGTV